MMPSGPCPADIMIVGEAPGAEEERLGRPFVGTSGQELDRMLHEAGLLRSECFVTNVCRVRPAHNIVEYSPKTPNGFVARTKNPPKTGHWTKLGALWVTKEVVEGAALLQKEIDLCQPKVIIALGNLSLCLLSGKWGISDWRGSSLPCLMKPDTIVLPTYHPAAILRQWSWRAYVISDLRRVQGLCTNGLVVPRYNFITRPHLPQVLEVCHKLLELLKEPTHLSCDIETRAGHIACIGIAWSHLDAICIPLMCEERKEGYWSEEEEFVVVKALREVLCHPNARISGQNFIYDTQYFWRWLKFIPNLGFDTMLGHHVCWPGTDKDLATLASLYCEQYVFWKHDGKEWRAKQDENQLWRYNCEDGVRTWEISEDLCPLLEKLGLVEPALFQHRMWWRALFTMITGVRMNVAEKKDLSAVLLTEISQREEWLNSIFGHVVNVRSPKQMKELFYDDLQLPVQRNRKSGLPTLDEEAMLKLSTKEPLIKPILRRILEIRSLGVFRSTFVEGRLDRDGRMRCSYNVAGPETFRLSSSENAFGSGGNLQNIPKGGEVDSEEETPLVLPNVRKLFIPDPGYEIADMDLASADLRIVTWEADEPEMKAMFAAGLDPYTEIAKEFYDDPSITKQDTRRQIFKSFAHGTNYLGTARGLATRLGLGVREAERTQEWYFNRFKRIKVWQDNLRVSVTRTHSVKNAFGYRRFYFDRIDGTIFNQAAAWIPQSTVGLLINKIWDRVVEAEPEILVLLQVHDSLVLQYPIGRAAYFRERIKELSVYEIPYEDPLVIPTGFKYSTKSWGHCE